jgi:hypothetical protein
MQTPITETYTTIDIEVDDCLTYRFTWNDSKTVNIYEINDTYGGIQQDVREIDVFSYSEIPTKNQVIKDCQEYVMDSDLYS